MYIKLTSAERLEDLRKERGLTLDELAKATNLSSSTLNRYELNEDVELSPHSLRVLADFYGVSADYLLGLTEMKNHPDADLHDLHLSEAMFELLKSGRINNRLLCEIATHPGFPRFLADVEIYVDRIADMRVNDMNAMLNAVRQKILETQNVDQDDLYVRTLEVGQVSETDYFIHLMQKDLDVITGDIRKAHKTDSTTADTTSPAADAQAKLLEAMRYEGSAEEKKARVFLAELGIDYDKISKEEFVALIGILEKSELHNGSRQRRKHKRR